MQCTTSGAALRDLGFASPLPSAVSVAPSCPKGARHRSDVSVFSAPTAPIRRQQWIGAARVRVGLASPERHRQRGCHWSPAPPRHGLPCRPLAPPQARPSGHAGPSRRSCPTVARITASRAPIILESAGRQRGWCVLTNACRKQRGPVLQEVAGYSGWVDSRWNPRRVQQS